MPITKSLKCLEKQSFQKFIRSNFADLFADDAVSVFRLSHLQLLLAKC